MADAKISSGLFIELGAGGDQLEMPWPAHGEIVGSKISLIAEVRIPAFARTDKQNAIAGVFDDVAAIMETKSEFLAFLGRLRQHDLDIVVSPDTALLEVHPLILEMSQRLALRVSD